MNRAKVPQHKEKYLEMKDLNRINRLRRKIIRQFHRLLRVMGFRKHEFDYPYAAVLLATYFHGPDLDLGKIATWAGCELEFVKLVLCRMAAAGPWTGGGIDPVSTSDRWFDGPNPPPGFVADVEVAMGLSACDCDPDGELVYTRRRPN